MWRAPVSLILACLRDCPNIASSPVYAMTMVLIGRILVVLSCAIWLALPASAQELLRSEVPEWVTQADFQRLPDRLFRHLLDGQAFHIVDRQVRWHDGRKETYYRIAVEAVNRSGLEAVATLTRDFDPVTETLTLVQLDLRRGDATTDLKTSVSADVFRRETNLESGIINGALTALIQIPGVQVGDIIDAAFIWSSEPYFEGDGKSGQVQLEFGVPVGFSRFVLNWPATAPLQTEARRTGLLQDDRRAGDVRRLTWHYPPSAPRGFDDDAPPEHDQYALASYSGLRGWGDITDALAQHYTASHALPEQWQDRVDEIARANESDDDRAYAALRLVQDSIRYVGIEVGEGGYFARPPEKVVSDQFGDCKDKSVLLKTVLEELGLTATVALANLDYGHGLNTALPSVAAFNHMIVGTRLDGRWVWMDPTGSHEGGSLATSLEPDLGYVLPIHHGSKDLLRIRHGDRPRYQQSVRETYTFTPLGMLLVVETLKRGDSANRERRLWATTPIDDIKTRFTEYYARAYPGIIATLDPVTQDDRQMNEFRVLEYYLLPRVALDRPDLLTDFPFRAQQPFSYVPEVLVRPRDAPLWMPHQLSHEHEIRIRNSPIEFIPPDPFHQSSAGFEFDFSANTRDGGNMDLKWEFRTVTRSVPAKDVPSVVDAARKAREHQTYWWDLSATEHD